MSVFEYTDVILKPSLEAGIEKEEKVIKEYRTAKNRLLNRLDDETFEIVETGQRVKGVF